MLRTSNISCTNGMQNVDIKCRSKQLTFFKSCRCCTKQNKDIHLTQGQWVFGAVERVSGKCFLTAVPDRSAATLESRILQHILPGTHIISDGWAAHCNLKDIGHGIYQDSFVRYMNFRIMCINEIVFMNDIENLWMRAKRKLHRQFGTSRELFPSYLTQFQYRETVGVANLF